MFCCSGDIGRKGGLNTCAMTRLPPMIRAISTPKMKNNDSLVQKTVAYTRWKPTSPNHSQLMYTPVSWTIAMMIRMRMHTVHSAILARRDRVMLGMGGRMATGDSSADVLLRSTYRPGAGFLVRMGQDQ